jgi:hypothetical protein
MLNEFTFGRSEAANASKAASSLFLISGWRRNLKLQQCTLRQTDMYGFAECKSKTK